MLITSYNQPAFGDTLIAITGPDTETQTSQRSGDIVAILDDQNHVIGYNFFNVSPVSYTHLTLPTIRLV